MEGYFNWRGLSVILVLATVLIGGIDQTTKDGLKVGHILRTIEYHPPHPGTEDLSAEVTEKELNAYIAYRLALEKDPVVSDLTLNLLDNNHVQGIIRLDAQRLNLDTLLGENLDFDFKGLVHSRKRAARLNLISLRLNGYPVKPQVLDFVLGTIATYYGTELGRVDDWYALPKGIDRITVKKAMAVLYY